MASVGRAALCFLQIQYGRKRKQEKRKDTSLIIPKQSSLPPSPISLKISSPIRVRMLLIDYKPFLSLLVPLTRDIKLGFSFPLHPSILSPSSFSSSLPSCMSPVRNHYLPPFVRNRFLLLQKPQSFLSDCFLPAENFEKGDSYITLARRRRTSFPGRKRRKRGP